MGKGGELTEEDKGRCFYLRSSIAVRSDQGECTTFRSDLHPLRIQAIAVRSNLHRRSILPPSLSNPSHHRSIWPPSPFDLTSTAVRSRRMRRRLICFSKSSNFYSTVHDVVIFSGGFVVWLWNLPLSYLYSLGQALPILPLGAANVYTVALCEWDLGCWKSKL